MIASTCQRWRDRRGSYRPAGEPIATRDYEVALLDDVAAAKRFVARHHYEGSMPAVRARVGLYRHAELVGVLIASHPMHDAVLKCLPGTDRTTKAELGRFVLLDDVPAIMPRSGLCREAGGAACFSGEGRGVRAA